MKTSELTRYSLQGVHVNGWRVIENTHTNTRGDVYDATHPFYVEKHYPKTTSVLLQLAVIGYNEIMSL